MSDRIAHEQLLAELEEERRRCGQLELALRSRIVLEQATGILSERFGWDPARAFELLRTAARSARMRIDELALHLVESAGTAVTPQPILDALSRNVEWQAASAHAERAVRAAEPAAPLPARTS